VVKKVQVKKVVRRKHRDVERRANWKKFGECAGKPRGPESGVTMVGDEVFLESSLTKKKADAASDSVSMGIVCRHCGAVGDHFSLKCPYKEKLQTAKELEEGSSSSAASSGGGGAGRYVAPGVRNRQEGGSGGDRRSTDDPTVRVTNLSEDTKESDLHELFSPFGSVKRIFLAKDKKTGMTKGFAFVTYVRREDAQRAIEKLSGYGYDHLILHLEWAKPANY
jgi:translation initiation factor 3 subunit G